MSERGGYGEIRCGFRCTRSCSVDRGYFFFLFERRVSCVPDDAEISREVAEWDGALLPLLARNRGRGETSVSRKKETQPNNNPKERYRTVVQRGVAEGRRRRGKRKWLGVQSGAGRSLFGVLLLFLFLLLVYFFILSCNIDPGCF